MPMFGSQWLANAGSYAISQSVRFNDDDSAYLVATLGPSPTDADKFTISTWVKRGNLGTDATIFSGGTSSSSDSLLKFETDNTLRFYDLQTSLQWNLVTTAAYRDTSAWYHIVAAVDIQNGTAANRVRLYVNGVEVTAFGTETNPGTGVTPIINSNVTHAWGRDEGNDNQYFDGYIAEMNFVDGLALTPTSFGETNDDGVWIPKAYTGSYGTNGFFIDGRDSSDLGDDESGNGNDFTSSGLTSDDQVSDSPIDNYCTWNPLDAGTGTLSEGNTVLTGTSDRSGTFGMSSGKWAWKITTAASTAFGVVQGSLTGTESTYTATSGEVLEFEFNADTGVLEKSVDGGAYSGVATGLTSGPYFPLAKGACTADFGASGFTVDDATFKYLSTANLPAPTIADGSAYFQTTTYDGLGYPTEVNQSGNSTFQPDFVWVKRRNGATQHNLFDAVRGVSSQLYSSLANAEGTVSNAISFDADGFTAVADPITGDTGSSGNTFVGWQWLAANGTASNTNGSINTTATSANTTAGISISTYTGNATSGATIGHGLGVAPDVIIVKNRDAADAWQVYHSGVASDPATDYLVLNTTAASVDNVNRWNDTAPTSSVFSLGNAVEVNTNTEDYVAYCFAGVDGFSKFGSYTGNGSTDGPFIFTGFKPAFVLFKKTSSTDSWELFDNTRPGYNATGLGLLPNTTAAEATGRNIDILSNGIKQRNANGTTNESGDTYIYMAFAEHPFGGDGVAPATAR